MKTLEEWIFEGFERSNQSTSNRPIEDLVEGQDFEILEDRPINNQKFLKVKLKNNETTDP